MGGWETLVDSSPLQRSKSIFFFFFGRNGQQKHFRETQSGAAGQANKIRYTRKCRKLESGKL